MRWLMMSLLLFAACGCGAAPRAVWRNVILPEQNKPDWLEVPAEVRVKAGILLGGEWGGTMIPGFDLDNSPMKYAASVVAGKTVVFTTTNGTQALLRCRLAARTLVGCFSNLHAVIALPQREVAHARAFAQRE